MAHTIDLKDMALARAVARRFGPLTDSDLESAAMKGLMKAAHTFDGRGTWRGYAHRCCVWAVTDMIEARNKRPETPMAHEDLTTVADERLVVSIEVPENTTLANALQRLPEPLIDRMLDGRIDRRRRADRRAIEGMRQALT